jgi:hypothetical protein
VRQHGLSWTAHLCLFTGGHILLGGIRNLEECANMVCHRQHTYVYSQVGYTVSTGGVSDPH